MSCNSSRTRLHGYSNIILSAGATLTARRDEADIILVDTCAYTKQAEIQSLDLLKVNDRSAKSGAKVIACGCLGAINPKALTEKGTQHFFSPQSEGAFAKMIGLTESQFTARTDEVAGSFMTGYSLAQHTPLRRMILKNWIRLVEREEIFNGMNLPVIGKLIAATQTVNSKAYAISISQGCLGNCSFCVIPLAKGRTQSTAKAAILARIREKVSSGVKRIVLTSEDIGAYGRDSGSSFIELLDGIHEIPGNFSLHCYNLDPRWLNHYGTELIQMAKRGKIRSFDIPIQSGSDTVLKRMIRAYEISPVMQIIREMRKQCPRLALATHLIAGFPGETEAEFRESRRIARSGLFDWVIVFPFSLRPGSQAEKMENHLPSELVHQRARRLQWDWRLSHFNYRRSVLGTGDCARLNS